MAPLFRCIPYSMPAEQLYCVRTDSSAARIGGLIVRLTMPEGFTRALPGGTSRPYEPRKTATRVMKLPARMQNGLSCDGKTRPNRLPDHSMVHISIRQLRFSSDRGLGGAKTSSHEGTFCFPTGGIITRAAVLPGQPTREANALTPGQSDAASGRMGSRLYLHSRIVPEGTSRELAWAVSPSFEYRASRGRRFQPLVRSRAPTAEVRTPRDTTSRPCTDERPSNQRN